MTVLVTRNPALFADISYTPDLSADGGVGPVAIGIPLVEAGENPRYAVIHPFADIDEEWVLAYCSGENPAMQILDEMPGDWVYQGPT